MLLVVARDFNQFRQYLRESNLTMKDALYLHRMDQVFGRSAQDLERAVFLESWADTKDAAFLKGVSIWCKRRSPRAQS